MSGYWDIRAIRNYAVGHDLPDLRLLCDLALYGHDTYLDEATEDCLDGQGRWDYTGAGYDSKTLREIDRVRALSREEAWDEALAITSTRFWVTGGAQ